MESFLTVTFGQMINALQVVHCTLEDDIVPLQASAKPSVVATFREAAALDSGDGTVMMFRGRMKWL